MLGYQGITKEHNMNLKDLKINNSWTLFLDRDGVINRENKGDYIKNIDEFEFLPGALGAMQELSQRVGLIIVITNQRGIAKGLMTEEDLNEVHTHMMKEIERAGGRIDGIYFCPHEIDQNCSCRKPKPGMALQAKADHSEIDFERSLFVGDKVSDVELGREVGMVTVHLKSDIDQIAAAEMADLVFEDLQSFTANI